MKFIFFLFRRVLRALRRPQVVKGSLARSRFVKVFCVAILVVDILLQPWLAVPHFAVDEIGFYRDLGGKVRVIGEIVGELDVRSDAQNLVVNVREIFVDSGSAKKQGSGIGPTRLVHGKIMVKAQRYPEYSYGDILDISCKLQTPPVFEKFSYAALLAKDDIFALCSQPGIRKLDVASAAGAGGAGAGEGEGEGEGVFEGGDFFGSVRRGFWSSIFTLKSVMIARMNELYSEPAASLAAGILIGARRAIPQEILDDFNTAGLTHVLAISGYNVSMMIAVFGFLCSGAARRWRYAAMFFGVMGLVVLTGFSASVLRAAWMGCITLFAQALGRKGSALHLLLVSAVVMVFFSPRMILVDLSFQLSFLSTLGILIFMPKIEAFEKKFLTIASESVPASALAGFVAFFKKIPSFMREGFYVTCAAQVFTTPLLLFQFGRFSLIAPVANIFVLPLVPWLMLLSFCGLILSFLFFPLGQLVSFGAYILVTAMLFLVKIFASLPFAALHF